MILFETFLQQNRFSKFLLSFYNLILYDTQHVSIGYLLGMLGKKLKKNLVRSLHLVNYTCWVSRKK